MQEIQKVRWWMDTNSGTNGNGKLDALHRRKAALEAAITAEKITRQKKHERENARLASIIGAALIEVCSKQPESVGVMVRQILAASSLRETDRAFLAGKGWC
jgi:hypothetical protein